MDSACSIPSVYDIQQVEALNTLQILGGVTVDDVRRLEQCLDRGPDEYRFKVAMTLLEVDHANLKSMAEVKVLISKYPSGSYLGDRIRDYLKHL